MPYKDIKNAVSLFCYSYIPYIYQNILQFRRKLFTLHHHVYDHQNPWEKSIRQVLQTIIIDVVQDQFYLNFYISSSRDAKRYMNILYKTFNMFYAERLIWYCFGALDLTFNPWGTSTKLKPHVSSCLPSSTRKIRKRKSAILSITKDNISTAQDTKAKYNDLCSLVSFMRKKDIFPIIISYDYSYYC